MISLSVVLFSTIFTSMITVPVLVAKGSNTDDLSNAEEEVSKEMEFDCDKEESSKVPESSKGGKSSYNSGLFF